MNAYDGLHQRANDVLNAVNLLQQLIAHPDVPIAVKATLEPIEGTACRLLLEIFGAIHLSPAELRALELGAEGSR